MRTLVACAVMIGLACLVHAESLAQAAAREKERRKAAETAGKKYTAEDLERAGASRRQDESATPTPESDAPRSSRLPQSSVVVPKTEAKSDSGPSDMAALEAKIRRWRNQYSSVKNRIEQLEKQIRSLEDEESRENVAIPTRGYEVYRRRRMESARADLKRAREQLDQIEEQARLDGVSTGQLY